jgi:hypothetical protein
MGSWLAREAAIVVAVAAVVVVAVQLLFNVELGKAIGVAVAVVVVFITISLMQWRNAAGEHASGGDVAPRPTSRYNSEQYARLQPGMSVGEVDAIMGGGGQSSESEIGGDLVRQYVNEDGSHVTVSFQNGSMSTKAMAGL